MKLLLQHKILFGYIILIVVIGSMAATMFHERNRVHRIEEEITEIRGVNQTINAAHRHITVLATLGESAITWDDEDYQKYQLRRQKVDSLLQILQREYGEFISFNQIDTFRILLANKEEYLFHTMKIHQRPRQFAAGTVAYCYRTGNKFSHRNPKKERHSRIFRS